MCDKYCKDNNKYSYSDETIQYCDSLCNLQNDVDVQEQERNSKELKKIAKKSGTSISDFFTKDGKKKGLYVSAVVENIIKGIFSEEGLTMLGAQVGVELAISQVVNFMLQIVANGISPAIMELAVKQSVGTLGELNANLVSNALLTSLCTKAVEEGAVYSYTLIAARMITDSVEGLNTALLILQIMGMIMDLWDPQGYSQELTAVDLHKIGKEFNNSFKQIYLENIKIGSDEFGNPVFGATWPVEYYADYFIFNDKSEKDDEDRFMFSLEYLTHLNINSNGEPINWVTDVNELLNPDSFKKGGNKLSMEIAGNNQVFASWLRKNFIIILVIIGIIIVFLIFIK